MSASSFCSKSKPYGSPYEDLKSYKSAAFLTRNKFDSNDVQYKSNVNLTLNKLYKSEIIPHTRTRINNYEETQIKWYGRPLKIAAEKTYFSSAIVGDEYVFIKDFVEISNSNLIGQIKCMWEDNDKRKMYHAQWFVRSCYTILGHTGNKNELFLIESCSNCNLKNILKVVNVQYDPELPNRDENQNIVTLGTIKKSEQLSYEKRIFKRDLKRKRKYFKRLNTIAASNLVIEEFKTVFPLRTNLDFRKNFNFNDTKVNIKDCVVSLPKLNINPNNFQMINLVSSNFTSYIKEHEMFFKNMVRNCSITVERINIKDFVTEEDIKKYNRITTSLSVIIKKLDPKLKNKYLKNLVKNCSVNVTRINIKDFTTEEDIKKYNAVTNSLSIKLEKLNPLIINKYANNMNKCSVYVDRVNLKDFASEADIEKYNKITKSLTVQLKKLDPERVNDYLRKLHYGRPSRKCKYVERIKYSTNNLNNDSDSYFSSSSDSETNSTSVASSYRSTDYSSSDDTDEMFDHVFHNTSYDFSHDASECSDVYEIKKSDYKDQLFFCRKRYNRILCRFEDLENLTENHINFCTNCVKLEKIYKSEIPTPINKNTITLDETISQYKTNGILWRNEEYKIGSCIFILPQNKNIVQTRDDAPEQEIDEDMYPEKYRKRSRKKLLDIDLNVQPFDVAYISNIFLTSKNISSIDQVTFEVKKFFRPENILNKLHYRNVHDMNLLYWNEESTMINFSEIRGKCYVSFKKNIKTTLNEWFSQGPVRFYFEKAYDCKKNDFFNPPIAAQKLGKFMSRENDSNGFVSEQDSTYDKPESYQFIRRPLRSLDVFAGCGGLTYGLHKSGVADCHWAIENDKEAAKSFKLNYPRAAVFIEDCNYVLNLVNDGQFQLNGMNLPQKGDVELLCGGPPCQGFSSMNMYSGRKQSILKNSLIATYLSYCDYYRPRFFILENVRNFISFKNSEVLKHTLACLVKMGYQCTFGVLQAGSFGVPQSRRRVFILAAAAGEKLPFYPEPTHTCPCANYLKANVNREIYTTNIKRQNSAPYRMINVYDAISDLPIIEPGQQRKIVSYDKEPLTHFQRMMRYENENNTLRDHVCFKFSPLHNARIKLIPYTRKSDWQDLPNIVVKLSDGTTTKKLKYTHHDKKNGRSLTGALRGVCACASGKKCNIIYRQKKTLIPWSLVHAGNRNGHFAGTYGRISYDDVFQTVMTTISPTMKNGRVIHPRQNRVVSVRECARSQGFPDNYKFYGSLESKYRQVGNAVPPPLAREIGYEIRKCLTEVD